MFKNIIVGIDGSETSEHALHLTCDIAQKYNSQIHLIHVPQPQTVAFAMGAVAGFHTATTMPSPEQVKEAGDKILNSGKKAAREHGLEITEAHLKSGDPAGKIIEYAESCGADLIVTGRRGLGNIGSLLQGSTSQAINHKAKCACLSVT